MEAKVPNPFEILDNYESYPPTKSCYLDGRYVDLVLKDVEEFSRHPIKIKIIQDKDGKVIENVIKSKMIEIKEGMNIIRVIIKSTYTIHSALLWLNTDNMVAIFTNIVHSKEQIIENLKQTVYRLIEEYINVFGNWDFDVDEIKTPKLNINDSCTASGFCNAYVIKQVLDYANNAVYDPNVDILRFAAAIEANYSKFLNPNEEPEVEYFFGLGLGIGLLGGFAIGGAIGHHHHHHHGY
jgi:hypothetical protein